MAKSYGLSARRTCRHLPPRSRRGAAAIGQARRPPCRSLPEWWPPTRLPVACHAAEARGERTGDIDRASGRPPSLCAAYPMSASGRWKRNNPISDLSISPQVPISPRVRQCPNVLAEKPPGCTNGESGGLICSYFVDEAVEVAESPLRPVAVPNGRIFDATSDPTGSIGQEVVPTLPMASRRL
ncbi:hypothetical protein K491DRAFT_680376 [Lophiostoma macrostomum CBS 122681]|uniref:Uncharacterized protein n=1 Tax=Lophiostoma macrostomum CBS 122681 TaxID=1314788 RepID=A0A6A6T1Q0_9PLEO|nr:hypothetical protein K491DRAFT_680376 [Lophiostoma macrostomum CBS 122681]